MPSVPRSACRRGECANQARLENASLHEVTSSCRVGCNWQRNLPAWADLGEGSPPSMGPPDRHSIGNEPWNRMAGYTRGEADSQIATAKAKGVTGALWQSPFAPCQRRGANEVPQGTGDLSCTSSRHVKEPRTLVERD
jgi:hypothetical protein